MISRILYELPPPNLWQMLTTHNSMTDPGKPKCLPRLARLADQEPSSVVGPTGITAGQLLGRRPKAENMRFTPVPPAGQIWLQQPVRRHRVAGVKPSGDWRSLWCGRDHGVVDSGLVLGLAYVWSRYEHPVQVGTSPEPAHLPAPLRS